MRSCPRPSWLIVSLPAKFVPADTSLPAPGDRASPGGRAERNPNNIHAPRARGGRKRPRHPGHELAVLTPSGDTAGVLDTCLAQTCGGGRGLLSGANAPIPPARPVAAASLLRAPPAR